MTLTILTHMHLYTDHTQQKQMALEILKGMRKSNNQLVNEAAMLSRYVYIDCLYTIYMLV